MPRSTCQGQDQGQGLVSRILEAKDVPVETKIKAQDLSFRILKAKDMASRTPSLPTSTSKRHHLYHVTVSKEMPKDST